MRRKVWVRACLESPPVQILLVVANPPNRGMCLNSLPMEYLTSGRTIIPKSIQGK